MKTATKSSIFSIIEKSSRTAHVAKNLESMLDIVLRNPLLYLLCGENNTGHRRKRRIVRSGLLTERKRFKSLLSSEFYFKI